MKEVNKYNMSIFDKYKPVTPTASSSIFSKYTPVSVSTDGAAERAKRISMAATQAPSFTDSLLENIPIIGGGFQASRRAQQIMDASKEPLNKPSPIISDSQNVKALGAVGDFLTESTIKPIVKGATTASIGALGAGLKNTFGGAKLSEPLELPWVGNINPNANTPQQNVGLATDFASGFANVVAPYKSAGGAFLRGGVQSAAKEAEYNRNATAGDIVGQGVIGGGLSAALSPQAFRAYSNTANSMSSGLYNKVLQSSDKQLKSGINLGQELKNRGLAGTTKQLSEQVDDIGKTALKTRTKLFKNNPNFVNTDDIINQIDDFAGKQTPAPGTTQRFNSLKDRIVTDIKAKGDRISLADLTKLKSALQSEAKSAFGTEGSQGKELYKGISNVVKRAAEQADDTGKLANLNKDIRFSLTAKPKLDKVLERARNRQVLSFGDAMTTAPGAAVGALLGGVGGAGVGAIAAPVIRQALNTNFVKSGAAKTLANIAKTNIAGDRLGILSQGLMNSFRRKPLN
jgi:hypothetical protein